MNAEQLRKARRRVERLEIKLTAEEDIFEDAAQELARIRKLLDRTRGKLERARYSLIQETSK